MPSLRTTAGFTLVELLIALAVMGILASLAIPSPDASLHQQLQTAGQLAAAQLDYARSLAVANGSVYRVTLNAAGNALELTHTGTDSSLHTLPANPYPHALDTPTKQSLRLGELPGFDEAGVQLQRSRKLEDGTAVSFVEFGPLGENASGGTAEIWISCGAGAARRYLNLRVHPTTGLVWRGTLTAAAPVYLSTVAAVGSGS